MEGYQIIIHLISCNFDTNPTRPKHLGFILRIFVLFISAMHTLVDQ
jgi:hypothetical protein